MFNGMQKITHWVSSPFPSMSTFILICGRLDQSEYIGSPPHGSRIIHNAVLFYGKLEIESLDWLSAQGRQWLETDLRQRDSQLNQQGGRSGLTLARIYGDVKKEGSRITVWIQGEKNMSVRYLSTFSLEFRYRPFYICTLKSGINQNL